MSQTIYWHDYETFGANPAVDRPSQFAGVRTNLDLDVVGEPLMVYCKPIPDMLPAPDACLITGVTPQIAEQKGIPEPEFIARIHHEFSQPQTCVAGYNSLRFDDEVTRYTLYRNFYDPYAREWQNGNSRWDIIDMVRLTYALRPGAIAWPQRQDESEVGVPSFKLELLSQANGLEHESAHDALSDVLATIKLAQLIKNKEPKLYEYCWGLRQKHVVVEKIDVLNKKPLLHISSKIPARQGCATLIMPLCAHPSNKNAVICVDLCLDSAALFELTAEQLKERLYTPRSQLGEGQSPVPLKAVHINRCPVVLPIQMLDEENARRLHIDLHEAETRWQALLADQSLLSDLVKKAQCAFTSDFDGEVDADSALYQGFLSDTDRRTADQVKHSSADELASQNYLFQDERMNELLFRYKARYFPNALTDHELVAWQERMEMVFFDQTQSPSKLDQYEQELQQRLGETLGDSQRAILVQLKDWAQRLRENYG